MSEDLSKKTVLVIDNGLYFHVADKLAETFARVLYWTPWVSAFPKSNATLPTAEEIEDIQTIE